VEDAASAVMRTMRDPKVVAGAAASEAACCHALHHAVRSANSSVAPTERAAVEAFAGALLEIPRALLENGGGNSEAIIGTLMHAHKAAVGEGQQCSIGVDVVAGGTMDAMACGVFEPLAGKRHAYRNATATACGILSIDQCISIPAVVKHGPPGDDEGAQAPV